MTAAAVNILIGLVTSIVSGGSVWLWQKARSKVLLHRRAAFFGLSRGSKCLVVMPDKYNKPRSTAEHDVHAMIEAASMAYEVGSEVMVARADGVRSRNDDRMEFCIGGPISNPRSAGYLETELPGVEVLPFSEGSTDSMAILAGGGKFLCDRRNREHALIAKFTPQGSTAPVIVISGQTAIANLAGIVFLKREHRNLAALLDSTSRFCLVVVVESIGAYGHEAARLAADVTSEAFTPVEQSGGG